MNQNSGSPQVFAYRYIHEIKCTFDSFDVTRLQKAIEMINKAERVFVAGNGGSAAISSHLECDFLKNRGRPVFSLIDNPATLMMIANDFGYDKVIAYQVEKKVTEKDLLILISSSGSSVNVVMAAVKARLMRIPLIAMTGFSGGVLKDLCDLNLQVTSENYGVVEDCHQAIMHILSQFKEG